MDTPSNRIPYKPRNFRWERAKFLVKSQLIRFPAIKAFAIYTWRIGRFLLLKYKWKLITFIGTLTGVHDKELNADKVCWISPQRITYSSLQEFELSSYNRGVIEGDWDRLEKKFEELDVFIAFKQVCVEGGKWRETFYYQRILDAINKGQLPWGCKDQHDLDQRCEYLESLFDKIKREGYKSQHELTSGMKIDNPLKIEHEIEVNIGRNGDILFNEGAHRLAIAKLVGIQKIPIQITIRHPEWIKFRKEMTQYAMEMGGKTYQPLMHFDLNDIPAIQDDCENRFKMIKQNLTIKRGRLLDIGSNLGYFCHEFEEAGFECHAVEDFPAPLYVMKKLKRAENKKFEIIAKSIFECPEITSSHFDIILALNVFHHFLKTKESFDKFVYLLNSFDTNELFFESHLYDDPMMEDSYKNFPPNEFVKFIAQNSKLKNAILIGTAKDGRSLYKLH